ncbi:MAG TPA: glutamate racemase [Candidatus Saccharimonadales bacterium]|jgi:glutamate racemase|nr:glutamate racemase [Candidatus Saccharimonadales bacterium]
MAPIIGVFDSGFGGLTVLRELLQVVPGADYLYFGDTARLPYGSKSAYTVARYANSAANFLERHGAQMLVIACNTATALAFDEIRAGTRLPVIGVVEPGAGRVAAISKTRRAAVIATEATVASHAYQKALRRHGIEATEKACPLLVPLVEEGWIDHPITEQVAHIYLDEIFNDGAQGADVLMLGCTHYPLLSPLLRRVAPPAVQIVDSAECTAGRASAMIQQLGPQSKSSGSLRYFATDSVEKFRRLGSRFLGREIEKVELIDIEEQVGE